MMTFIYSYKQDKKKRQIKTAQGLSTRSNYWWI